MALRISLHRETDILHSMVYLSAILSLIHYYGIAEPNIGEPLVYGAVIALLLLFRVRKRAAASRHVSI
jgi:sulfoxide reductase heme-binding subunit YedZ